jgi:hypothetical protein
MIWQPDRPRVGFWMIRCCRACPPVAARIWECDHEPGEPDNKVDQPYWQGQIGLTLTPPKEIWAIVEFYESSPEQQHALANPPLSDRVPRNGRAAAFKTAPMARWRRERAQRITPEYYAREIQWMQWAALNKPSHPDFTYRKPVDLKAAPVPKWADRERFA